MGQGSPCGPTLPRRSDESASLPSQTTAALPSEGLPDAEGRPWGSPPALVSNGDKSPNGMGKRCPTPLVGLRFKTPGGRLIPIPCNRSTCPVCSRRQAMITAVMVGLDADQEQPRVVSTTTTRDPVTPARLREGQRQFVREVRRKVAPKARYCAFVEFTTGRARTSGGIRRPHQHALWKDLPAEACAEVEAIARRVWKRIAGAYVHEVEEIRTPAGAAMYVASHHQKESQAPPKEWGPIRRVRPSRGYWSKGAKELRQEATEKLRDSRLRWVLEQMLLDQGVADEYVLEEAWEAARARPRPVVVKVKEIGGQVIEVVGEV